MYTILGAGLSGLSVADHFTKQGISFRLYESKSHGGGHIYSEKVNGFVWDEGPHVSFTKYEYVKQYFENNCAHNYLEYTTEPTNYFEGNWIAHPAQSHMYAVPEPLRSECVRDLINVRREAPADYKPANYQEWIDYAFGKTFAESFPSAYTKKYWTTGPERLTTDWIGKRIYFPQINDMVDSAKGPLQKQTHYISKVRYPKQGGYYSFIETVEKSLPVHYNKKLVYISFNNRELCFSDGEIVSYNNLVSTLPLPQLIANSDAPEHVKYSAKKLKCSQVLIVNVVVNHEPLIDNHWVYVYDEDMYSTRINFTDLLAPENGIEGKCGIQVEVYFSDYNKLITSAEEVAATVLNELVTMKLIKNHSAIEAHSHIWLEWANVIFDNERIKHKTRFLPGWKPRALCGKMMTWSQ